MLEGPTQPTCFQLMYVHKTTRIRQQGPQVTPLNVITRAHTASRRVPAGLDSHSCATPLMDFLPEAGSSLPSALGSTGQDLGMAPWVLHSSTRAPEKRPTCPITWRSDSWGRSTKPTKFTKKSEGTKQEKGQERRRNQRQVQMEHRPKHLSSGFPPASLSACGAILKALGRGELSTLVHVALNPLWESS